MLLGQLVASGKTHGGAALLRGQHAHAVTVNDGPAVAGCDGPNGAMNASAAFLVAVVSGQETAAVDAPAIADALKRG